MTKQTVLIILVSFFFINTSWTQKYCCAYDLAIENMELKYPGYKKNIASTFQHAKLNSSNARNINTTYNIPVVVHVVWNKEEERLSEDMILSQIEVLNEDFQRLNPDVDNVRDEFKDIVGNPMISFSLEEIIYVETSALFSLNLFTNELPDDVKATATGGSDPWDVNRYLNIWICEIQPIQIAGQNLGTLLGYAYPPNDLDNWPVEAEAPDPNFDGIVLNYKTVGKNNPFPIDPGLGYEIQFEKGRTAVHEVGHYLGLRHIWGDADIFTPDGCDVDDGIEDTPNTETQSLFDCVPEKNTCTGQADDLPDMIENYMDYSSESCQNSFTIGQVEVMRSVLENQRCELIENINCSVATSNLKVANIDIHPNPSDGIFYLSNIDFDLQNFTIEIIDIKGKTQAIEINETSIDLSRFAKGIYLIRGMKEDVIFQQKLIKQ